MMRSNCLWNPRPRFSSARCTAGLRAVTVTLARRTADPAVYSFIAALREQPQLPRTGHRPERMGLDRPHDVSAEALCAEFHKPSPRRRSAQWPSSGLAETSCHAAGSALVQASRLSDASGRAPRDRHELGDQDLPKELRGSRAPTARWYGSSARPGPSGPGQPGTHATWASPEEAADGNATRRIR